MRWSAVITDVHNSGAAYLRSIHPTLDHNRHGTRDRVLADSESGYLRRLITQMEEEGKQMKTHARIDIKVS